MVCSASSRCIKALILVAKEADRCDTDGRGKIAQARITRSLAFQRFYEAKKKKKRKIERKVKEKKRLPRDFVNFNIATYKS